jgi:hypothetical protein
VVPVFSEERFTAETQSAEIGIFFDQEIFSLRPQRLGSELSSMNSLLIDTIRMPLANLRKQKKPILS